ncbi:hypothetical protein V8J88_24065 [Massilia sp. W12]|uniref:hypothetical protein n=1 Tax=Massilia sp. W12 TaxID=3126507 RepID=UPI0030CDD4F0
MSAYASRTLDDIAEVIRHADGECVFLIGAGASKSAGIPLANGLLAEIERDFPRAYARARDKSYNSVMAELTSAQRSKLLSRHMEQAKVNWAHLALAQMFHLRKIDRILTVNFDPLIMRACSMVGEFPAVYDLAVAQEFKPARIAPRSVFYLNGQHTGFTILNADAELQAHRQRLQQIVANTGTHRIWVVLGYSGAADPLLDVLAEVPVFDNGLYWIGSRAQPSQIVIDKLLSNPEKQAYFHGGLHADDFLKGLAQKLDCFPPPLLSRPFEHIEKIIAHIDFDTGGDEGRTAHAELRRQIADSRARHDDQSVDLMALLMAGKLEQLLREFAGLSHPTERQRTVAAWALLRQGRLLEDEASQLAHSDSNQAQLKWTQAAQKYGAALHIKPDMYEALSHWGEDLAHAAQALAASDPAAAQAKWELAHEKFASAHEIMPDNHLVLQRWGYALQAQGQALAATAAPQALQKWQLAQDKFRQALNSAPDFAPAALALMHSLLQQAGLAPAHSAELRAAARAAGEQAEQIKRGSASLALARLYAQDGELNSCLRALEQAEQSGQDGQVQALLHEASFQELMASLLRQANWEPARSAELRATAIAAAELAEQIQSGSASLTLARLYAQSGEADSCMRALEQALQNGQGEQVQALLHEAQFQNLRKHADFAAWLAQRGMN